MNKKTNIILKSTGVLVPLALLLVASQVNDQKIIADVKATSTTLTQKQENADLDVSQGWTIKEYSSDTQPDVSKIFLQGVDLASASQKCALVQAGNLGDSTLIAEKIVHMKKGYTYNINLIYAQFYDNEGTGYIDFNGEKIEATSDHSDQKYTDTITPTEDMDYTITISFKTKYPGNAYFKLGYDKTTGGITDDKTELDPPKVSTAPEAGTTSISGTAGSGNTVVVSDDKGEIGEATVSSDGKFKITTKRVLQYKEKLTLVQKNADQTSKSTEVFVVDTIPPIAPTINKITDKDKEISGTSEPGTKVTVTFKVGETYPTYVGNADSKGIFKIPLDQSYNGKTQLSVKATDEAGLDSPETSGEVVFANNLEVSLNHKISSISSSISGKTSRANCNVTIFFGSRIYSGKSDSEGNFTIQIGHHSPGTEFTIAAVDPIDIENSASISDKVLPRIPEFDSVSSGINVLKGIADPIADVSLTLTRGKDTFTFKVTADAKGNFEIPLKDKDGKNITLAVGDELKYSATLASVSLTSDEGITTIYTR